MTNANSVEDRIAVALLDGELELHQIGKAVPAVAGQQLQGALRVLDERGIVDVRRNDERKIVYFLTDGGETYAEAVKEGRIPVDPPRAWERRRGNGKAAAAPPASLYPPPAKRTGADKANAKQVNAKMAVAADRGSVRPQRDNQAAVEKVVTNRIDAATVAANEAARKAADPVTRENVVAVIEQVATEKAAAPGAHVVPMTSPALQKASERLVRSYLDNPNVELPCGDHGLGGATAAKFLGDTTPPEPGKVYQVELPPGAIIGGPGMHVLQGYVPARACITAELTEGNGLRMQSSVPSHYPPVVCIELDSDAALALYTLLHVHLGPKE